jgi:hypothetical protein
MGWGITLTGQEVGSEASLSIGDDRCGCCEVSLSFEDDESDYCGGSCPVCGDDICRACLPEGVACARFIGDDVYA